MKRSVVYAVGGVVLLLLAQIPLQFIRSERSALAQENQQLQYYKDLDPGQQLGLLVLGGFRGLLSDYYWMRGLDAKEQGRFFESVHIFEQITRLQPRFAQVWEYLAWDMAYNIAHEEQSDEGKWRWFSAGVGKAFDGMAQNPNSTQLLRECARILSHKGAKFEEYFTHEEWSDRIDQLVQRYDKNLVVDRKQPASPYRYAYLIYRACVVQAENSQQSLPMFLRRLVPVMLGHEARRLRLRGELRASCRAACESMQVWQGIMDWVQDPDNIRRKVDIEFTRDSYERNRGQIIRQLQIMFEYSLRDAAKIEEVKALLAQDNYSALINICDQSALWKDVSESQSSSAVPWLDEQSELEQTRVVQ